MCPNCKKSSRCGCKSCQDRNKGRLLLLRPQKLKGDTIKCPYCRVTFSYDAWLDEEFRLYELRKEIELKQ